MKKTILNRISTGIKLSWSLPSLPVSVNNYPFVRILKVIGEWN